MLWFAVLWLSIAATSTADQLQDEKRSPWQAYFLSLAKECRITAEGSEEPFELVEQPLLRWSQPIRGGDDGAVYLWLKDKRPAAIGTIFAWPHPDGDSVVAYEFHSLVATPLEARRRGSLFWSPKTGGISFKPVPEAQPPSDSEAKRNLQLRAIARRFRGATKTNEGVERALRLLPKPIYEYGGATKEAGASAGRAIPEGALFVLAQGTDPEVLILIEARRQDDGDRWEYSCARFSDLATVVRIGDAEVWSVERANPKPTEPHYYSHFERRQPPTAEDVRKLSEE